MTRQLSGPLGKRLFRRRGALVSAARSHGASKVRVFGSVARGEESDGSDVDLLVDLPPGMGLFGLARLRSDLEAIVGAPVDVIPASDLKPEIKVQVAQEIVVL